MRVEIVRTFKGIINDIDFSNEATFNTVVWMLESLDERVEGVEALIDSTDFVRVLKDTVEYLVFKRNFEYSDIEEDYSNVLEDFNSITDWKERLPYWGWAATLLNNYFKGANSDDKL